MRYLKQVIFENIGIEKQKILESSTVAVVGIGALGTAVSDMLVRAGVKNLILIDRDVVELSNLQRQTLFSEQDLDELKVIAAQRRLNSINNTVNLSIHPVDLDFDNIGLIKSDIILDCTDNFEARFLINDFAVKNKIPWIYASVIGSTGMTFNILPKNPCLRCIFKEPDEVLGTCDTEGIINTIIHSIAAMQVTEAIKILTKQQPNKELVHYDVWKNRLTKIKIKKNKDCPTCNNNFEYLLGKNSNDFVKTCGSSSFHIKTKIINLNDLNDKLKKLGETKLTSYCLFFKDIIFFRTGRAIVKAENKEEAKIKLAKYLG